MRTGLLILPERSGERRLGVDRFGIGQEATRGTIAAWIHKISHDLLFGSIGIHLLWACHSEASLTAMISAGGLVVSAVRWINDRYIELETCCIIFQSAPRMDLVGRQAIQLHGVSISRT